MSGFKFACMLSDNPTPPRQCGICHSNESPPDQDQPPDRWVKPCQCPLWFHMSCLLPSIWRFEVDNPGREVTCAVCSSFFIVLPRKDYYVLFVEGYSYILYEEFCVIFDKTWNVVVWETLCALFGLGTLSLVFGRQDAVEMLSYNIWISWAICRYVIPWSLFCIGFIPWDDILLQALRKISRIPIIRMIMPKEDPNINVPVEYPPFYMTLVSALLLPCYSLATGRMMFPRESNIRSVLMGGAFFMFLTGVFRMYYKQKMYCRSSSLNVHDFNPQWNV